MKAGAVKKVDAHIFELQAEEHYVEPLWCDTVLFANEGFVGSIHDPCCGFGRIPYAARSAGHDYVTGSDIERRMPDNPTWFQQGDFLRAEPGALAVDNIVMNPPFGLGEEFIRKACSIATRKVAAIYPTRRLNAAHWMRGLGLIQVWYLTPRPSMPPGHVVKELEFGGKQPSGGKQDFCWVVFERAKIGRRAEVGWLHRDRGVI